MTFRIVLRQSCAVCKNLQINHEKFQICGLQIGTQRNLQICGRRIGIKMCRFAIRGLKKKVCLPTYAFSEGWEMR
jgi:hypothetical protein